MCVNIGHGDPRVITAIAEQAAQLPYANPFLTTEPRARLGAKLAEIAPGRHRRLLLHQRRRRGQRERVQDRARRHRPPEDPGALPLVPRRHGGGDHRHRRSAALEPAADAGHRPRARSVSRHRSAAGTSAEASLRVPRGSRSSSKARRRSRRSSSRPSPAPTASSCRPTATCRACGRSATSTAS